MGLSAACHSALGPKLRVRPGKFARWGRCLSQGRVELRRKPMPARGMRWGEF